MFVTHDEQILPNAKHFSKELPMAVRGLKLLSESFFGDIECMVHVPKLVVTGKAKTEGLGVLYDIFWSDD